MLGHSCFSTARDDVVRRFRTVARAAVALAIGVTLSVAPPVTAQPPATNDEPVVEWQKPFELISASAASERLVLMLITNDDPFATAGEGAAPAAVASRTWCGGDVEKSLKKVFGRRPDLKSRMTVQALAAGMPRELTGDVSRNSPSRALVAVCDGQYRLLAVAVGVPQADSLQSLIEDAEEVSRLRTLRGDASEDLVAAIAQRSAERFSRSWRNVLEQLMVEQGGDVESIAGEATVDPLADGTRIGERVKRLQATLQPVYLADVSLRFGLRDATDRDRLLVLEQHPETRRPWCEAIIPFLANIDWSLGWSELVESIWNQQPITAAADADELLGWYDLHVASDALVVQLQVDQGLAAIWPPIVSETRPGATSWREVHDLALQHPFRVIRPQQLAILIRSRGLDSVDIERPSLIRYLYFHPKRTRPVAIRQADPPGRFASLLERSKSSLVPD